MLSIHPRSPYPLALDGVDDDLAEQADVTVTHPDGKRAPIVAIRSWHGECARYRQLAKHLEPDQPLYTVGPPRGEHNDEFPLDCPTWANMCVDRLAPHLSQGQPIYLMGWSFGGLLALEVAHLLEASGAEIGRVVMIDSEMPRARFGHPGVTAPRALPHRMVFHVNQLFDLPQSMRRDYVAGKLRWKSIHARDLATKILRRIHPLAASVPDRGDGMDAETEDDAPLLLRAIRRCYSRFQPVATRQALTLLWCQDSRERLADSALGWGPFALGPFEMFPMQGQHMTLFQEPHVGEIARRLSEVVERAVVR